MLDWALLLNQFSIATSWGGPVDYSGLPEPKNIEPGNNFSPSQLKNGKALNLKQNGGVLRSDEDGALMNPSKQSRKGIKADMNQVEGDHQVAKTKGGTNSNKNLRLITKKQNLKKGDK